MDQSAPPAVSNRGSLQARGRWLTATRVRRRWFVAVAVLILLVVAYIVEGLSGPRPDATLHPVENEADGPVSGLLGFFGADVDRSSIRGFEAYRGFEPWFTVDNHGLHCFLLFNRSTYSVDGANCVPPGVDLFADIGVWPLISDDYIDGLPYGSVIRFHYRGDSVDVFVYPASEE